MFQHFGAFLGRDKLSDKLAEHQETIWAIDFPRNLYFYIIPKRFTCFLYFFIFYNDFLSGLEWRTQKPDLVSILVAGFQ